MKNKKKVFEVSFDLKESKTFPIKAKSKKKAKAKFWKKFVLKRKDVQIAVCEIPKNYPYELESR